MDPNGMGIDPREIQDLKTVVGTSGALGMNGLADDPIFEFTVAVVVLTNGISGS